MSNLGECVPSSLICFVVGAGLTVGMTGETVNLTVGTNDLTGSLPTEIGIPSLRKLSSVATILMLPSFLPSLVGRS